MPETQHPTLKERIADYRQKLNTLKSERDLAAPKDFCERLCRLRGQIIAFGKSYPAALSEVKKIVENIDVLTQELRVEISNIYGEDSLTRNQRNGWRGCYCGNGCETKNPEV